MGIFVEFASATPYIISGIVAIGTAFLTHKRATRAHKHSTLIDQQTLVNETYEMVLGQVRTELTRMNEAHGRERGDWERQEELLLSKIRTLETEVANLRDELDRLNSREQRVEQAQETHLQDEDRHTERRSHPRIPDGDSSN